MFALGAGEKFDVNGTSEYVETIICKLCVCVCGYGLTGGHVFGGYVGL